MQIPQLTKYILEELERGTPELAIKQKLFQSKWLPDQIEENYEYALLEAQQLIKGYKTTKKTGTVKTIIYLSIFSLLIMSSVVAYLIFFTNRQPTSEDLVRDKIDQTQLRTPASNVIAQPSQSPLIAVNNQNDKRREQDRILIQSGLSRYFAEKGQYPQRLGELKDLGYLLAVPNDVTTNNPYQYEPLQDRKDYKLCIAYEEQGLTCFNRLSN